MRLTLNSTILRISLFNYNILNRNKKRHTTHVWIALDPYVYTVCLLPKTNVFNEYCSLVSKKTNLGFPNTLNGGWMDGYILIRMKHTYHSLNILFNWKLIAAAVVATTAFGILYRIDLDLNVWWPKVEILFIRSKFIHPLVSLYLIRTQTCIWCLNEMKNQIEK